MTFWRRWLDRARIPDHRYREPIQRSALAIKGLTYMPTGATVAALTTGLPETPGGERNWDYRYSWMRDSTFTLQALHWLNLDWEADEFMQFVADLEPNDDGGDADHVRHRRAPGPVGVDPRPPAATPAPVRCGSATGRSTSARTTCSAPCSTRILLHSPRSQRLPRRLWPIVQAQAVPVFVNAMWPSASRSSATIRLNVGESQPRTAVIASSTVGARLSRSWADGQSHASWPTQRIDDGAGSGLAVAGSRRSTIGPRSVTSTVSRAGAVAAAHGDDSSRFSMTARRIALEVEVALRADVVRDAPRECRLRPKVSPG